MIEVEPKHLNCFKIQSTRTSLAQIASIVKQFAKENQNPPSYEPTLEPYVRKIEKTFNFFYASQQPIDSLPIIILYGPSGCGKTRCVEQACSNLSLFLNKVNLISALDGFFFNLLNKFFQQK